MDRDHFESFYNDALPRVYGYLFRRCGGDEADAKDLTQETFLGAVRALKSGVEVEEPMPWLMSIARRRLVDYYRRAEVRRRPYPLRQPTDPPDSMTNTAEPRLLCALETIPPNYRLALVLRYVDDLPVADVAALIDKTPAAAESLLARARRALAEAYEDQPDE